MARLNFVYDKEFELDPRIDDIAKEMLKAASKPMLEQYRNDMPKDTHIAEKSIKTTQPRKHNDGHYTVTYPRGVDRSPKNPVRNNDKVYWYEYGHLPCKQKPNGQDPRPFLDKAIAKAKPKVYAKMQEVYDRRVIKK